MSSQYQSNPPLFQEQKDQTTPKPSNKQKSTVESSNSNIEQKQSDKSSGASNEYSKTKSESSLESSSFKSSISLQTPKKQSPRSNFIPIINRSTTSPDFYDVSYITSPTRQSQALRNQVPSEFTRKKSIRRSGTSNMGGIQSAKKFSRYISQTKSTLKRQPTNLQQRFKKIRIPNQSFEKQPEKQVKQNSSLQRKPSKLYRSSDQIYKEFSQLEKIKEEKIINKKQVKQGRLKYSFKPKITKKSQKILADKGHSALEVHQRLFNHFRQKNNLLKLYQGPVSLINTEATPEISPRSQNLNRKKAIQDILYQDAVRRMKKMNLASPRAQITFCQNSSKILISGFLKEFEEAQKKLKIKGKLNYSQFIQMFQIMNFSEQIRGTQEVVILLELWDVIRKNKSKIGSIDLKVAMMGIMGYYKSWMDNPGHFRLKQEDVFKFKKKYKILLENREAVMLGCKPKNQFDFSRNQEKFLKFPKKQKNLFQQSAQILKQFEDTLKEESEDETENPFLKKEEQQSKKQERILPQLNDLSSINQTPSRQRINTQNFTVSLFKHIIQKRNTNASIQRYSTVDQRHNMNLLLQENSNPFQLQNSFNSKEESQLKSSNSLNMSKDWKKRLSVRQCSSGSFLDFKQREQKPVKLLTVFPKVEINKVDDQIYGMDEVTQQEQEDKAEKLGQPKSVFISPKMKRTRLLTKQSGFFSNKQYQPLISRNKFQNLKVKPRFSVCKPTAFNQ